MLLGSVAATSPVRPTALHRESLIALPAGAIGPVSAALGGDAAAYRVGSSEGALVARNPAQRLRLSFRADGVSIGSGSARVGLGLRAIGFGSTLRAIAPVAPRAQGNRVTYGHGAVQEWYANGPLGLEQGFTIARAPAAPARGPLTLAVELSGNASASPVPGADGVRLKAPGAPVLGYGGLTVTDAAGRLLPSRVQLSDGRVLLRVQADGARYPLRVDPFVHQGEKLTAGGLGGPYGYVGMSVALSADGNTALIGAPADDEYTGSAFVFTRTGSAWAQQGEKLTGGDTVGEAWFGESVALSADGNTALIGAPSDNGQVGAAWVFTRSGSTWTQDGEKLTGAGESGGAFFGRSVALSADGATALVGGYQDDEHRGAAWVFTRSGSTWSEQGEKLTGGGGLGFFGWSGALSANGNTALIGEWGVGGGIGAAWVFTRSGSTWSRQGEALTGEGGYSWFGYSVALSADGNTALVGAPHGDGYAGSASVFARSGATWAQQGEPLTGAEELGEGELGYSAALSADGEEALLGGRVDGDFHGAAWAFRRSGSVWSQDGAKLTADQESANREEFGWSVALSSSGLTALVGSPCDKACIGSASAFVTEPAPPEFGRCEKIAKGSGRYANAGCTASGGKLDYEWEPGAVAGGFTTALVSGAPSIETVGGQRVSCSGETGTGGYSGQKRLDDVLLRLTGCALGGVACASVGAEAGELVSRPLEGMLGVEKSGASTARDRIGLDLFPAGKTGALFEFACGATAVAVRGSAITPVKSSKMSASLALKFKAAKGRQKPEGFAEEAKDVLEASFAGGPYEQAGLTLAANQSGEEPLEVNPSV